MYFGENALPDNLFDYQWHGNNYLWFNLGECLGNDSRTWNAVEIIDVATATELEYKLEGHAIHVGHGQNADDVRTRRNVRTEYTDGKVEIAPQGAIRNHYAF